MSFDGILLSQVVKELNAAIDCRVEKIHQPDKNELIFLLRRSGLHLRLLVCTRSGSARLHFTSVSPENPPAPPMFCMLLRKHLCGARLTKVTQAGLDRVVMLSFEGTNELGDITSYTLTAEFLGALSNLILTDKDGRIIDALRRSDLEKEGRMCLPGALYTLPENQRRINVFECDEEEIAAAQSQNGLLNTLAGLSPLVCREAEFLGDGVPLRIARIIKSAAQNPKPVLTLNPDGSPRCFSYMKISQYGKDYTHKEFGSFCDLLDAFYLQRDKAELLRSCRNELEKTVSNYIARTSRKLTLRMREQESCAGRETLRIYGELLKANLHAVSPAAKSITVKNYYSENFEDISIPLDPALTPAQNAAKYFKDYKKKCVSAAMAEALINEAKEELAYFESVNESIARAESRAELNAVREELVLAGYLRANTRGKKSPDAGSPKEYNFREYHIFAGKNNRQNDILTFKIAGKNDLWLHARNIPGAHVILFCNNRPPLPEAIEYAAKIAAQNSSGAKSGGVAVDYTLAKYVKKPAGAKPGRVTYDKFSTVYIKL